MLLCFVLFFPKSFFTGLILFFSPMYIQYGLRLLNPTVCPS